MAVRTFPSATVHGTDTGVAGHLLMLDKVCYPGWNIFKMSNKHLLQGIKAVVTLNEEFEVFISTRQYQACSTPCHLLLAPLLYHVALSTMQTLLGM